MEFQLVNKDNKKLDSLTTTKVMKYGIFSMFGIIIVGFIVFSSLFGISGSGVNVGSTYDTMYQYEIVLIDKYIDDDNAPNTRAPKDPFNQQEMIDTALNHQNEMNDILTKNGVNIQSESLIKNESNLLIPYTAPDDSEIEYFQYEFTYGFLVESTTRITLEQFDTINAELALIDTADNGIQVNENGLEGFVIYETFSAYNISENEIAIQFFDQTVANETETIVYGLLVG
jgi:hypothetical protein